MPESTRAYTPDWSATDAVKAFTTTRGGGVSKAPYNSLNLGDHVGDLPQAVAANRQILVTKYDLPQEPCWLNQTHSTKMVRIEPDHSSASVIDADGATTMTPGVVCAILTADCMPVLLCNRSGSQVAAVHVGWRGLAHGILENAIKEFADDPVDLLAWAGPCIGPEAFEIGLEVRAQLGGDDSCYRASQNAGKCYADLHQIASQRLHNAGVHAVTHSSACTFSEPADFFSFRRDGVCGRMATLIWIDA